MTMAQSRRSFLGALSSASAAVLSGAGKSFAQEGPPETTTVRIDKIPGICIAPLYVVEELLRAEGFTDIRYVATEAGIPATLALARGEVDFTATFAPALIVPIDAGVFASANANGEVDHTFLTSIVDQRGILRVQYLGVRFDPDEFRRDLLSLVREQ